MPNLMTSVDVDFEVYCGVCGTGCCRETDVRGDRVTITCPTCARVTENVANLEDEVCNLEDEVCKLEDQVSELEGKLEAYQIAKEDAELALQQAQAREILCQARVE